MRPSTGYTISTYAAGVVASSVTAVARVPRSLGSSSNVTVSPSLRSANGAAPARTPDRRRKLLPILCGDESPAGPAGHRQRLPIPKASESHVAIALGILVTEAGYQAYFTSAADMVANLQTAHLAGSALYKLRTYLKPFVLVIDELGYLPLDQASANWIFQVVSRPCEKSAPIVLTSNRGFSDWGQVFADPRCPRTPGTLRPSPTRPRHPGSRR